MQINSPITSKDNKHIKLVRSLLERGQASEEYFLVEGQKATELVMASFEPLYLLTSQKFISQIKFDSRYQDLLLVVADALWKNLGDLDSPPRLIGIFRKPKAKKLNQLSSVIVLDRIQDPGNLGVLIRTAVASGWDHLICLQGTADPFSPKVLRACAGSLGGLELYTGISIAQLKDLICVSGLTPVEAVIDGGTNLKALASIQNPCLMLGNEGQGLDSQLTSLPNAIRVTIPNHNPSKVESLNVSVAGGILMYGLKGL